MAIKHRTKLPQKYSYGYKKSNRRGWTEFNCSPEYLFARAGDQYNLAQLMTMTLVERLEIARALKGNARTCGLTDGRP